MENASKAIAIAGGILIGLLTISIFVYMFSNISNFVDETSPNYNEKEVQAFNQGFEAYNKKLMYGSDVISVINKAIDNNTKYKTTAGDDSGYSVDVVIRFNSKLSTSIVTYKKNPDTGKYEIIKSTDLSTFDMQGDYSLKANYSLIISNLLVEEEYSDGSLVSEVSGDNSRRGQYTYIDQNTYKMTYYPAAEFRRRTFKCVSAETLYSPKTGRIEKMVFEMR